MTKFFSLRKGTVLYIQKKILLLKLWFICICTVCNFLYFVFFFQFLLMCTQCFSGFNPNSMAPPCCQSPHYFQNVTWAALMEHPQTLPWVSYSGGIEPLSSHLSENQASKTSSNCAQALSWPSRHRVSMTNPLNSNVLF